jgi:hypothetical protein
VWWVPGAWLLGHAPGTFRYGYYTMDPVLFAFRIRSVLIPNFRLYISIRFKFFIYNVQKA